MSAIELDEVFRVYSTPEGDAAALQGLSLRIEEGEIVVVLGPSGSGKSTLLRLLAGLDRPSAGAVRVFGTDLARLPARRLDAYRAGIGYVDQHYVRALAPELSARELVALHLGLAGEPAAVRNGRALELLERVGLEARAGARPAELSGGEQQRVAVCAALAHRPRLLLADEPTGELDAANAGVVYGLLSDLSRELGCTTVIVSHDPTSAEIADRAISIRDGRVSEEAAKRGGAETIVVGRGGWLRLPEELLLRAGIAVRATARLGDGGVVVSPAGEPALPLSEAPSRRRAAAGAGRPVASVSRIVKAYANAGVFDGFDASFSPGRLHAVTGPSGSGKTTLLHLLAGLELPDAGEVEVLETTVSGLGTTARADFRRQHVALVRQESGLVAFLSARENLELALALRGRDDGRAEAELDAVGLGARAGQRVSRLSAGEQTRVDIARALAAKPALLLADEPTARLDQANALAVTNLLASLAADTGAAVVCATHDPIVSEQADTELRLAGPAPVEPAATAQTGP